MTGDESYSMTAIDMKFETQTRDLKEYMGLLITPLTAQVSKANGRTSKLEEWAAAQDRRSSGLKIGGQVIFFFIVAVVFPIITWLLLGFIDLKSNYVTKDEIKAAATEAAREAMIGALDDYNISK